MSGGWAGSSRRARLPASWPQLRAAQLDRDGHQCTWPTEAGRCPAQATDVDHVEAMTDDHGALQSLCATHHKIKSAREGGTAWAAHRATARHQREAHPGLT